MSIERLVSGKVNFENFSFRKSLCLQLTSGIGYTSLVFVFLSLIQPLNSVKFLILIKMMEYNIFRVKGSGATSGPQRFETEKVSKPCSFEDKNKSTELEYQSQIFEKFKT